jgi:hypothetical protein
VPITKQPNIKWPIGLLEVGDSFFVPAVDTRNSVRVVNQLAAERGMSVKFHAGIDTESGLWGLRIIRVS